MGRPTRNRIVKSGPSDVTDFISTGSTHLDLCISGLVDPKGRGGIPCGRFTEIFGPESSGKSYLSGELLRSAQDLGWERHLIDVERSFEFDRCGIYDLNPEHKDFYYYPDEDEPDIGTVEDVIGIYQVSEKKVKKGLINRIADKLDGKKRAIAIIDSIAVLSTRMEVKGSDKRGQDRAKKFSQSFRQSTSAVADKKLAVVFDNQVRSVETAYGSSTDSPGGWAIKHYASVRIELSRPSLIRIKDTSEVIGVRFRAEVVKNKVDVPYRRCSVTLNFKYGIDDIRDCAAWLKENTSALSDKQSIYQLPERKGVRGIEKFIVYVEDNDLEGQLTELMREEWKKVYSLDSDRKPRKRV